MKIMVYDTECNSLDTENGFIQELAWAVYDVDFLDWRLVSCRSEIIEWNEHYEVETEAFEVTGLSQHFCNNNGKAAYFALMRFKEEFDKADFLAGQNVLNYDRAMMITNFERAFSKDNTIVPEFKSKKHIDTYYDIRFPKRIKPKGLSYLALDHGYFHHGAHQAMSDVFACAHVLSKYPIEDVIEVASTPFVLLQAKTEYNNQKQKEAVYSQGFRWNPELKVYEKRCREFYVYEIRKALDFAFSIETLISI